LKGNFTHVTESKVEISRQSDISFATTTNPSLNDFNQPQQC
jgi:hypothetical protein